MRPAYTFPIVSVLALLGVVVADVDADTIHFKNRTVLDDVKILAEDWREVQVQLSDGVVLSFSRKEIEKVVPERRRGNAADQISGTMTDQLTRMVAGDYRRGQRAKRRALELRTVTKPDGTTVLESAPQLIATVMAERRKGSVLFSLDLRERGGAAYAPGAVRVNGKRFPPPGFEVRDAEGELVHRGKFEYG